MLHIGKTSLHVGRAEDATKVGVKSPDNGVCDSGAFHSNELMIICSIWCVLLSQHSLYFKWP